MELVVITVIAEMLLHCRHASWGVNFDEFEAEGGGNTPSLKRKSFVQKKEGGDEI